MDHTKITHEVINFKVPADLKAEFSYQCGKDERTVSQQLRVLMLEYIGRMTDQEPSPQAIENAAANITKSYTTKSTKKKPHFTRGK